MKLSTLFETYRLYHDSYSDAVQHAVQETQDQGYQIDEDDFHSKVTTGPRKPSPGEYNRFSIDLLRDGKPVNRKLHVQIYNMDDSGKYELNMYLTSLLH
jgi:hypothetical protein